MNLLQEIRQAVVTYMDANHGRSPDTLYLSRGMVGILRNELDLPDGVSLKKVLGMEIRHQPGIVVTREVVD